MTNAVVLFFLLDALPDFDVALNKTLEDGISRINMISAVQDCDSSLSNPVLEVISKKLKINVIANWSTNYLTSDAVKEQNDIFKELSPEALYNIGTVFDSSSLDSVENIISSEKVHNLIDSNYINSEENDLNIKNINKYDKVKKKLNVNETCDFPKNAPFLVAIFETLSNVTAQTCGGTLLSPHWVLTAANCINLLVDLYNNTSSQEESQYTVIVGATNPLIDGSAHSVSKIIPYATLQQELFSPNNTETSNGLQSKKIETNLVLMMIEPPVVNAPPNLKIMEENVMEVTDVRIYGWISIKNNSIIDSMQAVSFPAITLNESQCNFRYNLTKADQNSTICLVPKYETDEFSQLNTGGPVLTVHNNQVYLLALMQTVDQSLFIVQPLSTHAKWIENIIKL